MSGSELERENEREEERTLGDWMTGNESTRWN